MIYSLNSPNRSSCLFADPQQRTRKALKSLIFSSLKYEIQSMFDTGISLKRFFISCHCNPTVEANGEDVEKWSYPGS